MLAFRRFLLLSTVLSCGVVFGTLPGQAQQGKDAIEMSDRAFEGAQWVLATQAARAVAQVGARAAAGEGPLGDSIRLRQRLEQDLTRVRAELSFATGANGSRRAIQDRIATLIAELDRLDAEIRAEFPEYAEFADPKPLGFDALRDHLAPNEALVLFLSTATATYVWAVSDTASAWHRADLSAAQLSDMVRKLRVDLDPTGTLRAATPLNAPVKPLRPSFDTGTAHTLYKALLDPVMSALDGVNHLYVVKDGPLASLPLAVLRTAPHGDLQDPAWLVDRFALTTLPAVASLGSIRAGSHDPRQRTARFAGFGDPAFRGKGKPQDGEPFLIASRSIGAFFDSSGTRLDAIRALAPLPGTARELRRIANLFPPDQSDLWIGAAATETAVKTADLSQVTILSFATHGLVSGDMSGLAEPALALTPPDTATADDDGLLTASEASALTLNADWVILSACNTAAGDGTPGAEGLSGLARAFLFAGARSILVSHWPVRDDVAATLTSDTLRRLNETPGLSRSQALRLAIQDLKSDPRDPTLAHPSAWAPFVIVGEGGSLD